GGYHACRGRCRRQARGWGGRAGQRHFVGVGRRGSIEPSGGYYIIAGARASHEGARHVEQRAGSSTVSNRIVALAGCGGGGPGPPSAAGMGVLVSQVSVAMVYSQVEAWALLNELFSYPPTR